MDSTIRLFIAFTLDILIRILFNPGVWSPDLLLIAIVYITMTRPLGEAYVCAFVSGIVWDSALVDISGMHAFLFILAAMIVAQLRTLIWGQYAISRFFLGFSACALIRFGEVMISLSNHGFELPVETPQQYILRGALSTGIVFFLIPWNVQFFPAQTRKPSANSGGRFLYE